MVNLVNLFLLLLGLIGLIAVFFDNVVFLDARKKVLNQKFVAWWKTLEHFDKLQLALVCAKKVNEILDLTFGKSHFSKKVFFRCSVISTGILLITLAVLGMINRQPFGVAPWKAYSGSISSILTTTHDLIDPSNYATFNQVNIIPIAPQINVTTNLMLINVNSNLVLMTMTTNGIYNITRFDQLGNGGLNIGYNRFFQIGSNTNHATNSFGRVTSFTNPHEELVKDINELNHIVAGYNTTSCIVAYSIGFYLVL